LVLQELQVERARLLGGCGLVLRSRACRGLARGSLPRAHRYPSLMGILRCAFGDTPSAVAARGSIAREIMPARVEPTRCSTKRTLASLYGGPGRWWMWARLWKRPNTVKRKRPNPTLSRPLGAGFRSVAGYRM